MSGRASLNEFVDHSAAIVALLVAWSLYTTLAEVPVYLLPPPSAVAGALADGFRSGELWGHVGFTLVNLLAGFFIGSLLGAVISFVLGAARWLERWVEGPILILQTAPKIALAPLFVIWFGLGPASKIVLIASLVLFPVLVATIVGVRSIDPRYHELAQIVRLTRAQRIFRIELPSALPDIFVGLRIGILAEYKVIEKGFDASEMVVQPSEIGG